MFELAPITLLLGKNSAGKSTLFHALQVLAQSWEPHLAAIATLTLNGALRTWGTWDNVVHGHQVARSASFGLKLDGCWLRLNYEGTAKARSAVLRSMRLNPFSVRPNLQLRFAAERVDLSATDLGGIRLALDRHSLRHLLAAIARGELEFQRPGLSAEHVAGWAKLLLESLGTRSGEASGTEAHEAANADDDAEACAVVIDALAYATVEHELLGRGPSTSALTKEDLELLLRTVLLGPVSRMLSGARELITQISYIGPLRTPPARVTEVVDTADRRIGPQGERMPLLLAREHGLLGAANSLIRSMGTVPYLLDTLELGASSPHCSVVVRQIPLKSADNLTDLSAYPARSFADVGFGVGQLMPVLVEYARLAQTPSTSLGGEGTASAPAADPTNGTSARTKPGSIEQRFAGTLLVEQPELHIHPGLQADVVSVLAGLDPGYLDGDDDEDGEARDQRPSVIAETHSEHMVLRLQRHVRRKHLSPADVSIIAIRQSPDGVQAQRIRLHQSGEFLESWPDGGFFDERWKELEP